MYSRSDTGSRARSCSMVRPLSDETTSVGWPPFRIDDQNLLTMRSDPPPRDKTIAMAAANIGTQIQIHRRDAGLGAASVGTGRVGSAGESGTLAGVACRISNAGE